MPIKSVVDVGIDGGRNLVFSGGFQERVDEGLIEEAFAVIFKDEGMAAGENL
jgi:hypothetical protein